MTKNQIFDQKAKIYEKLENFTQKYKCRLKVENSQYSGLQIWSKRDTLD